MKILYQYPEHGKHDNSIILLARFVLFTTRSQTRNPSLAGEKLNVLINYGPTPLQFIIHAWIYDKGKKNDKNEAKIINTQIWGINM